MAAAVDVDCGKTSRCPAIEIAVSGEREVLDRSRELAQASEVVMAVSLHVRNAERRDNGKILKQRERTDVAQILGAQIERQRRIQPAALRDEARVGQSL
jgi:hypothetical protein